MTLDIDGVGAKAIKFNFREDMKPGFVQEDQTVNVTYNSDQDNFSWDNSGRGISILTSISGTANAITASGGPSITGYVDQQLFAFKVATDNTAAVTLTIGSLPTITIKNKGNDLTAGQMKQNVFYIVAYNSIGPVFELISGAGDVVGPGSVTDARVVAFDGTTGKLIKQGTRLAADLVAGPASSTDNRIALMSGTGGKTIKQSSFAENQVGSVMQIVMAQSSALNNSAGTYPDNTSIPQVSEGKQIFSLGITPKFATSTLFIDVELTGSLNNDGGGITALHLNGAANSIAGSIQTTSSGSRQCNLSFSFTMAAGSVSLKTFTVRVGSESSGIYYLNANESNTLTLGTIQKSSIKITEIRA